MTNYLMKEERISEIQRRDAKDVEERSNGQERWKEEEKAGQGREERNKRDGVRKLHQKPSTHWINASHL